MRIKQERKTLSIRISKEDYEKLQQVADYNGVKISNVVRNLITSYVSNLFWER